MTQSPDLTDRPIPAVPRHSLFDDLQGIVYGCFVSALSVVLMQHLGFVTGQTAGAAILLSYLTGWSFGLVFFVVNLPFYWFGWKRFGPIFVAKSLLAVTLMSVLVAILPRWLEFGAVHPALGACIVGALTASGLIALFRHGASLGGIGIVGLYIQDATGFPAGWVQLAFDVVVFAVAFLLLDPVPVAWSALGAVVLNVIIAINHRRDRYIAA